MRGFCVLLGVVDLISILIEGRISMLFAFLIFVALAFIYDLLRSSYRNQKKQTELLEQLKIQNDEIIKLLSNENKM